MKIDSILDAYRLGDADKRLSLFLFHRELRDEFSRIEQDDWSAHPETCKTTEPVRQSVVQKVLSILRNRSCCLKSRTSMDRAAP